LPGSVASILAEGAHPLAVEIQALVTPAAGSPARVTQGIPATRLRQLTAVLDAHGELGLGRSDVFVACSGAVKAAEPAVDMAVMTAILSAHTGVALDPAVVCLGEVGLTGAFRPVAAMDRRLREAERIGLTRMVVPRESLSPTAALASRLPPWRRCCGCFATSHQTHLRLPR